MNAAILLIIGIPAIEIYLMIKVGGIIGALNTILLIFFTAITGVNTLFNGLLNTPGFSDLDFSSLRFTLGGGMAVQKAVADKWKSVTGAPLIEAYGLTETSPAACMNPMNLKDFNGTVGLPISSTEVVIKDEGGTNLKLGEVGEICIKGLIDI